jgi:hypothetical protein
MHEISANTTDMVNLITFFSSAGEDKAIAAAAERGDKAIAAAAECGDKLIAEIAIIGKEFNSNFGQAISDFNNNCGQVTSAITGVANEIREILNICKWVVVIIAVVSGVCGIIYAWRQWKKQVTHQLFASDNFSNFCVFIMALPSAEMLSQVSKIVADQIKRHFDALCSLCISLVLLSQKGRSPCTVWPSHHKIVA